MRASRALLLLAGLTLLRPSGADAQDATVAPTVAPTPVIAAVPLPEVARRSDDTAFYLRELAQRTASGPEIEVIDEQLPLVSQRLRALRGAVARLTAASPALRELDEILLQIQELQDQLSGWSATLTTRATELEREIQGLNELRGLWRVTRDEARAAVAPPAVLERIKDTSALILETRKQIDAERGTLLVLLDQVVKEEAEARDLSSELTTFRRDAVGRLFVRDAPPVWAEEHWTIVWSDAFAQLAGLYTTSLLIARDYLSQQASRLPLLLVVFGVLFLLWRQARARTAQWLETDDSLSSVAAVFEHPISASLFLTLLATLWIFPQASLLLRYLVRIACVPPLVRVLDRMVDRPIVPGLFALGAFFTVDQLRGLLGPLPFVEQLLFLLEMVAGLLLLAWMLRTRRLHRFQPTLRPRVVALLERGLQIVVGLFALALVAGALGYMQLARVVAGAVLGSGYAAMLLFALMRFAQGVWAVMLRTPAARRTRMVTLHRPLLERRGERLLAWLAFALWALATLKAAELFDPLRDATVAVITAQLRIGDFSVSLQDLITFGLTVWLAFLVSRFARFVLEEDVYPRVRLTRGLPYALSSMLHYTILLIGFLIAMTAIGINLDRFTLLVGAFGVGIGFGLQNVVNNFISGLILLFERPVQVGDTVQIGSVSGEVRRIGIRSSTLRTFEGAEVIVPNGNLIADAVTNWTLSDRMRRIDIAVGIAYGSDPEQVLELLRGVGTAHPKVVQHPPVVALFLGFGDSALNFELRCWTDRFEESAFIRSELAVAVNRTLRDAGIAIPFPQRDMNLNQSRPILVRVVEGSESN